MVFHENTSNNKSKNYKINLITQIQAFQLLVLTTKFTKGNNLMGLQLHWRKVQNLNMFETRSLQKVFKTIHEDSPYWWWTRCHIQDTRPVIGQFNCFCLINYCCWHLGKQFLVFTDILDHARSAYWAESRIKKNWKFYLEVLYLLDENIC